MTAIIISCVALAISILALAFGLGGALKAGNVEQDVESLANIVCPPAHDLAVDLRRQDLLQ